MRESHRNAATARSLTAALLLASAAAGCNSIMFVDGPPPEYQRKAAFTCTESYFWPVADTVLSATTVGTTILIASQESSSPNDLGDRLLFTTLVTTAVFAGMSAGFGYREVSACKDAHRQADDYRRWVRSMTESNAPAQRGLVPPPVTAP